MLNKSAAGQIAYVDTSISGSEWKQLYASCRTPLPSYSWNWASAVCSANKHDNRSRLYTFMDGTTALLPLFGAGPAYACGMFVCSPPPAWGFGGLVSPQQILPSHILAVMDDLAQLPAISIQIRPNPLENALWAEGAPPSWIRTPRMAHVLTLADSFEQVFTGTFKSDTRNRIRKAERAGLEIESGNSETLIAEFYSLLQQSVERWSRRQNEPLWLARWRAGRRDPQEKFRTMAAALGHVFKLWIARLDGKPVAGILVLTDRVAHYTRGAMDEEFAGKTYANYLLHAKAIEAACAAGCKYYHMGETGNSVSLAQFKSRFGADEVHYSEYRHERVPITELDRRVRSLAKRLIGFRDQ